MLRNYCRLRGWVHAGTLRNLALVLLLLYVEGVELALCDFLPLALVLLLLDLRIVILLAFRTVLSLRLTI